MTVCKADKTFNSDILFFAETLEPFEIEVTLKLRSFHFFQVFRDPSFGIICFGCDFSRILWD